MKINTTQRFSGDINLIEAVKRIAYQLNLLSEGFISAKYTAQTSPPVGRFQKGDQITNSNPTELGTSGQKYIITGWICTVSGEPATWREMRVLTGN